MKVLVYSFKDIYDKACYTGRAESDIIAYRQDDFYYCIVKDRQGLFYGSKKIRKQEFFRALRIYERNNNLDIPQVPT